MRYYSPMSGAVASDNDMDAVWAALGNAIRRGMLDALRHGPLTTNELIGAVDAGRDVTIQHLRVLRDANLITVTKRGRQRINHLNAVPIQHIYERWVSPYEQHWATALTGLKSTLEGTRALSDESERKHA